TNPLVAILNLSGITRSENGLLRVRNRIYERAFDSAWVTDNLPGSEKRRQREAYRRGVLRAILVGGVILAAVLALVIVAFKQRNRAIQETLLRRRLSYTMQVNLAYQELDYGQVNRVEALLAATAP